MHGGSLEITLTVPLIKAYIINNNNNLCDEQLNIIMFSFNVKKLIIYLTDLTFNLILEKGFTLFVDTKWEGEGGVGGYEVVENIY